MLVNKQIWSVSTIYTMSTMTTMSNFLCGGTNKTWLTWPTECSFTYIEGFKFSWMSQFFQFVFNFTNTFLIRLNIPVILLSYMSDSGLNQILFFDLYISSWIMSDDQLW